MSADPTVPAKARVLLLVPSMRGAGGTERVVFNLANLLVRLGHEVGIATFDAPGDPRHFAGEGTWFPLGPSRRLPLPLRPFEYLREASRVAALKRRFRPDVTISNLWRADLISQLSLGADRKVALAHINVVGNPTNRTMIRLRPAVAAIYRRFARVVAVSAPLADELRALYRLPAKAVMAIDNFTDPPPARPVLPDDGVRRLVWCGRLVPEKNLAGMLEVWAKTCAGRSDVQLVVLGDGPLRTGLEAQAVALGLRCASRFEQRDAQVVFAGVVANPADYMVSARAFVLSSLAEGMPMVLLEALSLGLPVLAADCPAGGVRAVLDGAAEGEDVPGALLPVPLPGDAASQAPWQPWLAQACDDDGALAAWRAAALHRGERFSSRAAGRAWQALLAEVLQ